MNASLGHLTFLALIVVMVTGVVERFFYGLVRFEPRDAERMAQLRAQLRPVVERIATPEPFCYRPAMAPLLLWLEQGVGSVLWWGASIKHVPHNVATLWQSLASARQFLLHPRAYARLRGDMLQLTWLRFRARVHRPLERAMDAWRVLHVATSLALVGLIGLHVWGSLRVGFNKWPWG